MIGVMRIFLLPALAAAALLLPACDPPDYDDDDDDDPDGRTRVEGTHDLEDVGVLLPGPEALAEAGTSLALLGDVNGDGYDDLAVGAPGLGDEAGGVVIQLGSPDGPVPGGTITGVAPGDRAGHAIAAAGDVDGDGFPDLLVGAPGAGALDDQQGDASTHLATGAAYLVTGGWLQGGSLADAGATLLGDSLGECAGRSVAGAGDVDGDGLGDLLVGAPCRGSLKEFHQHVQAWMLFDGPGAVYLVLGGVSGELSLAEADARFDGERTWDRFGTSIVGVDDQDHDGLPDLAVGSPDYYGAVWINQDARGRIFVFSGAARGEVPFSHSLATVAGGWGGPELHDELGHTLAWTPGGLAAGAPGLQDFAVSGGGFVVHGPLAGASDAWFGDVVVGPPQPNFATRAGTAVLADFDLDCDGVPDFALGAPEEQELGPRGGAVRVGYGPVTGYLDLGVQGLHAVGSGSEQAGAALESGDLDGDGCDELLVGSPANRTVGHAAGGVWWIEAPQE
jgi:hypothetical protein